MIPDNNPNRNPNHYTNFNLLGILLVTEVLLLQVAEGEELDIHRGVDMVTLLLCMVSSPLRWAIMRVMVIGKRLIIQRDAYKMLPLTLF
jgi:hypothetical protein